MTNLEVPLTPYERVCAQNVQLRAEIERLTRERDEWAAVAAQRNRERLAAGVEPTRECERCDFPDCDCAARAACDCTKELGHDPWLRSEPDLVESSGHQRAGEAVAMEIETEAERKAGVRVDPSLAWHQVGCVKRYSAESDEPCECDRRAQAALSRTPPL